VDLTGDAATSFAVTLERGADGTYLAWVDDLPGCAARARSREEVLGMLPSVIADFLEWTGQPAREVVAIAITEEVESTIEADEDTEVLVAADREPLTDEDWARVAGWLRRSRAELGDLFERLSDDELESTRTGCDRTVREEIEHVAFVELMYAMWTFDLRSRDGLADLLAWTREVSAERLQALARQRGDALTWAEWAGAPRPEPWTPRKAARRLLWHELLHLRAIERFVDSNDAPAGPV
jgi:predicted RNase H-like HicB family nuclease